MWLWVGTLLFASWARSAEIQHLEVDREGQLFQLRLEAQLEAPTAAVWATLTDYPELHRLSRAVQRSEVVGTAPDGSRRVYSLSHVCVWIFCRDLEQVQHIRPSGPGRLVAEIVPEEGDFAFGFSQWTLQPAAGGTRMVFATRLQPAFWVPPLLGPLLIQQGLRNTVLDTLQGLEREAVLRR